MVKWFTIEQMADLQCYPVDNLFAPKVITKMRDGDNADISFVALTAIYFPSVTGKFIYL